MKKTILLAGIVLAGLLIPAGLYASGRSEVTIINNTGAVIASIQFTEAGNGTVDELVRRIEKNGSTVVRVKNNTTYDIILIDTRGHRYSKTGLKWKNDARVVFRINDFLHESFWRTIDRALPRFN